MLLSNSKRKKEYWGVGLMSGTSLDGLDIALCRFSEEDDFKPECIHFDTIEWDDEIRSLLKDCTSVKLVDLQKLTYLHRKGAEFYAQKIESFLSDVQLNAKDVDFIGSHGHTIYHLPKNESIDGIAATLQLIDADQISTELNIPVFSDFRQKHIAYGGEGAPLAIYADYELFASNNENRILLNIGGMSNFTFIPASSAFNEIITTDTGPGNKLIDLCANQYDSALSYDSDGQLARKGEINQSLLESMLNDSFFTSLYPKSTGAEYFNLDWLRLYTDDLSSYETIATVADLTAKSIANGIYDVVGDIENLSIYMSGGGVFNSYLMDRLQFHLNHYNVHQIETLGYDSESKEAVLFALLAFKMYVGEGVPVLYRNKWQNRFLGKVSLP